MDISGEYTTLFQKSVRYEDALEIAHKIIDRFNKAEIDAEAVTRVVVTSGKLYYDIASLRLEAGLKHVPILRLEQLYPIPGEALRQTLGRFRRLREVVWAQEEAKNHGAWYLLREQLEAAAPPGAMLSYSGRSAMAPTAGCDAVRHATEQLDIARRALGVVAA